MGNGRHEEADAWYSQEGGRVMANAVYLILAIAFGTFLGIACGSCVYELVKAVREARRMSLLLEEQKGDMQCKG